MMKVVLSNRVGIEGLPVHLKDEIKNRLTITNPAWIENERMGHWNGNTPRVLRYYEETSSGLILPRGFFPQLIGIAKHFGERFQIEDRRRILPEVDSNGLSEMI